MLTLEVKKRSGLAETGDGAIRLPVYSRSDGERRASQVGRTRALQQMDGVVQFGQHRAVITGGAVYRKAAAQYKIAPPAVPSTSSAVLPGAALFADMAFTSESRISRRTPFAVPTRVSPITSGAFSSTTERSNWVTRTFDGRLELVRSSGVTGRMLVHAASITTTPARLEKVLS
jgi:hypothetical protein